MGAVMSVGSIATSVTSAAAPKSGFGWLKAALKPRLSQPKPADGPLDRVAMVLPGERRPRAVPAKHSKLA
ncbi:hypothetical protein GCM10007863_05810 [Dyella mobilis]|nr:hypothetical protein GCM10007863_05810 [Dyella mobilis]